MDRISDDEISLAVSGACGGIRAIFESKIGVENPLTNPAAMEKLEFIVKGYLMEILQRNGENSGGNAFEKVSFAELLDALDSKIDAIGEVVEWVRRKLDEGDEEEVVLDKEMIEPEDGIELIEDSDAEKDIGSSKRCSTPRFNLNHLPQIPPTSTALNSSKIRAQERTFEVVSAVQRRRFFLNRLLRFPRPQRPDNRKISMQTLPNHLPSSKEHESTFLTRRTSTLTVSTGARIRNPSRSEVIFLPKGMWIQNGLSD